MMATTQEIIAAANAMRAKRHEMIAQPLERLWQTLAQAALDASDRVRDEGLPTADDVRGILSADNIITNPPYNCAEGFVFS